MEKNQTWPWEDMAADGEPMPDGLTEADIFAYQSMRALYDTWSRGTIREEAARAERVRIVRAWRNYRSRLDQLDRWLERSDRLRKATDIARAEFRKTGSQEAARKLCDAVDGVLG